MVRQRKNKIGNRRRTKSGRRAKQAGKSTRLSRL